jgi:hypothetical protein
VLNTGLSDVITLNTSSPSGSAKTALLRSFVYDRVPERHSKSETDRSTNAGD